jgi:hypothetical protein
MNSLGSLLSQGLTLFAKMAACPLISFGGVKCFKGLACSAALSIDRNRLDCTEIPLPLLIALV